MFLTSKHLFSCFSFLPKQRTHLMAERRAHLEFSLRGSDGRRERERTERANSPLSKELAREKEFLLLCFLNTFSPETRQTDLSLSGRRFALLQTSFPVPAHRSLNRRRYALPSAHPSE